jgi:hypothetical protein
VVWFIVGPAWDAPSWPTGLSSGQETLIARSCGTLSQPSWARRCMGQSCGWRPASVCEEAKRRGTTYWCDLSRERADFPTDCRLPGEGAAPTTGRSERAPK